MVTLMLVLISAGVVTLLFLARACFLYYTSPTNFYRKIISQEGIDRMRKEQFESTVIPVVIVGYREEDRL